MMKKMLCAGAVSALCCLSAVAAPGIPADGTVVQLRGEAVMTVPNDEAVVTFSARMTDKTAKAATAAVTARANKALKAIEKFGDKVTVRTTGLSVSPIYTRAREGEASVIGSWEASERLTVTVHDVKAVSDVLGAGSENMEYDNIVFCISTKARRAQNEALLKAAVADALKRADAIAAALGIEKPQVTVKTVQAGSYSGGSPRYYAAPRMMAAKNSDSVSAPRVSAGETEVSLDVSIEATVK